MAGNLVPFAKTLKWKEEIKKLSALNSSCIVPKKTPHYICIQINAIKLENLSYNL